MNFIILILIVIILGLIIFEIFKRFIIIKFDKIIFANINFCKKQSWQSIQTKLNVVCHKLPPKDVCLLGNTAIAIIRSRNKKAPKIKDTYNLIDLVNYTKKYGDENFLGKCILINLISLGQLSLDKNKNYFKLIKELDKLVN